MEDDYGLNDGEKSTERGCARAAEQVFRTRELMLSVRSSCRIRVEGCKKLLHLLRCKRHRVQEHLGRTGKDGYRE